VLSLKDNFTSQRKIKGELQKDNMGNGIQISNLRRVKVYIIEMGVK
jgi:hypothetical protein